MQSVMARDPEEFARRRRDCPCGNRCRSRLRRQGGRHIRPLTGPLASNGKAILTAYQMWQEDINAKGDLPVARAQNNFDILRKNFKMRQGAVRLKRRLSRYLIIR